MIFLFFTKTTWNEPPRLRHQLARLLADKGHQVYFFQKPVYFWQSAQDPVPAEKNITLFQSKQFIHHQLRLNRLIRYLNMKVEALSLKRKLKKIDIDDCVVVNFNYDYYFLKTLYPKHQIITIINDDFVSPAKKFSLKQTKDVLSKTAQMSTQVLTVSTVLLTQLLQYCKPVLFLPWSNQAYKAYDVSKDKRSLLIWAYFNGRIDFDLIEKIAKEKPQYLLYLVGPKDKEAQLSVNRLSVLPNIKILPSKTLDSLPLGDFFAALIPYKKNIKPVEATTLANKSLQLMACGLPLVIQGMPNFYEHPAVFKPLSNEFGDTLDMLKEKWMPLQEQIKRFVEQHSADDRYQQFVELI